MTQSVDIYGFGSAFCCGKTANDTDILIVHLDGDPEACQLAILCKQQISELVNGAHITLLSGAEEAHFEFIKSAQAVFLANVRENHLNADLAGFGASISHVQKRA